MKEVPSKSIPYWEENKEEAREWLNKIENGEIEEYVSYTKYKLELALGLKEGITKEERARFRSRMGSTINFMDIYE